MTKSILVVIFMCLIFQGCQPPLNNYIDPDIKKCGISQKDLGNRRLVQSDEPLVMGGFQVFDALGQAVFDYEVTPKNCLILPATSPATSLILNNISEKSCLKINAAESGSVRISDADGNFLDASIQDILTKKPRQNSLLPLKLRGPLNPDEIFCNKNSGGYKLSEGRCVPKDIRDYCQEFRAQYGKKELEETFGKSSCSRLWDDFSNREKLAFVRMRLRSTKYFSGLPKLKGLNLSANPELGSFREMKGTNNIEELIVTHANFDLSEIELFPSLKSLVIGKVKDNWALAPSFPQIKMLEVSGDHGFDPTILEKFPNLETLIIANSSYKLPLTALGSLKKLKTLTIGNSNDTGYKIPVLSALEELEFHGQLDDFVLELPRLRAAKISGSASVKVLASSAFLEDLEIEIDPLVHREVHSQLQSMIFPTVTRVKLSNLESLEVLNAFPSVEELDISVDYVTGSDLASLRKLSKLRKFRLKYENDSERALILDDIYWPNLVSWKTECRCIYRSINAPKLEELIIRSNPKEGLDLSATSLPALKNLIIEQWDSRHPKLPVMAELLSLDIGYIKSLDLIAQVAPKLKNLSFCMDESFSTTFVPKQLETLSNVCYYLDVAVLTQFLGLKKLSLHAPDIVDNIDLVRHVEVESLELKNLRSDSKISELMNVLKVEKIISTDRDLRNFSRESSVAFNGVKSLVIDKLPLHMTPVAYRERFPDLLQLEVQTIWRDPQIRNVSEYSDSLNALAGLKLEYETFSGSLNDEVWEGLNCRTHQASKLLDDACSPGNFIDTWSYRPISMLGIWDYELP